VRLWFVAWVPAVLWAAVIFGLSSISGAQLPAVDLPAADKLAHLVVYAVLGALVLHGVDRRRPPPAEGEAEAKAKATAKATATGQRALRARDFAVAIALTTLYGVSDEIHQRWTPNRTPDWHDVVADALGAALGSLALVAMRWMKIRVCLMMGRSKN
jgi:VanZ family protein